MRTPPSRNVLDAFGASADPQPLEGGRGGTWRSGPIVLKPVDDAVESHWRASVLDAMPDSSRFRLARPIRAASGDWLHEGWEAAHHVVGRTDPSRWHDAIETGTAFHEAIAEVTRPPFLETRDDHWSRADRAAWAAAPLGDTPPLLKRLLAARVPVDAEHRMVHGDLLGNVLYEPGLAPAIIDWSPYWRPPAWAAAVAVVDALCWHGAEERLIDRWSNFEEWPQMLLRALLFRMITDQEATDGPWEPHPAYGPLVETLIRRALP